MIHRRIISPMAGKHTRKTAHISPTGYTKRRKQIWEALHPVEKIQVGTDCPPVIGYGNPPEQTKGFAASTAEASGMTKRSINQHLARADALGDDVERIAGTSLDTPTNRVGFFTPAI
jgi:hypothetical protein